MKKSIRARLNEPSLIALSQDGSLPTEVQVIPVGKFKTYIGEFDFTDTIFAEMASNFKRGIPNAVPINFDHKYGEAAGWVTDVIHKAGEGLFATVEWTSKGKEALTEKIYRFLSAEFDLNYEDSTFGLLHGAVLGGIGLTNYPMLQNLPALMSQEQANNPITILFSQEGAFMNLDEIRQKNAADLTEEERTFLQEQSAELTDDERTRFEIEAPADPADENPADEPVDSPVPGQDGPGDGDPAPAELSQGKKSGTVTLSQERLAALEAAANQGSRAMTELSQMRMEREVVEPMLFSSSNQAGKFLPKSKDPLKQFVFSLNDAQRKQFSALIDQLPTGNSTLLSEVGDKGSQTSGANKLNELAQAKVVEASKAGNSLTFSQALDEVTRENPALVAEEYSIEGDK